MGTSRAARPGSVLLIVLVVVALLALGAYTFSEFMIVEAEATASYGRELQARALADSGVELASSLLEKRYEDNPHSFYSNPERFEGVLVRDSTSPKGRGRFSVVSAAEQDTSGRSVRFGLVDESSKLNLNALVTWQKNQSLSDDATRTVLMSLPEMTIEIADAILDWIDTDETVRQNGAELEYYQGLNPPYPAKDNALDTLDELLLVRGVTPALLFGEDTNHNGILDPNENDGAATPPLDNADNILQRGWSAFLTVYSREINQRTDGQPRININQTDLAALGAALETQFDENTAKFIVAYRLSGPSASSTSGSGSGSSSGSSSGGSAGSKSSSGSSSTKSSGGSSGTGSSGGSMAGTGSSGSSGSTKSSGSGSSGSKSSGSSGSAGSGSKAATPSQAGGKASKTATVTFLGMDVSNGGSYNVKSLYELFGASTTATISNTSTSLTSPWTNKPTDLEANALKVIDSLTLTDTPYIDGRININLAPREILLGLPNMTPTLADSIIGGQIKSGSGPSANDTRSDRLTTAWLVTTAITDINTLVTLDQYITARGDVFHLQSVGYFDGGGPMARVEAVIDATQTPPQVVFMRDLTELGRGFSAQLLTTGTASKK